MVKLPITKTIKILLYTVLFMKLCALMIDLASQLFFTEERMHFINSVQRFLMSINIEDRL